MSDFRPLSITTILSHLIKKTVGLRWLRPAIAFDLIADQFAFRPTGSTTCCLSYFMHHVTRMLESNTYVRCLMVYFYKAFDQVDRVVLLKEIEQTAFA
jgi:hypothetical protein